MYQDFVNFPIIVETIQQVQQVMHALQFVIQNCLLIEVFTETRSGEIHIFKWIFFFFIVSASSRIIRLGKKVHTIHTSFDRTAKIDVIIINWFALHRQLSFVRFSIQEEWKGFRDNVGLSWNKNKSISISEAWMNRSFRRYLLRFRREQRS